MKNQDYLKLAAALIGGAAVGATLAVLFAPAKGADIRHKIAEESSGLKDIITTKFQELLETVSDHYVSSTKVK
jgi:gas vesicle protein